MGSSIRKKRRKKRLADAKIYKKLTLHPRIIYLAFLISILNLFCSDESREKSLQNVVIGQGMASWYGPGFDGKRTANGDKFNMNNYTAAHREIEFGTLVKVTNIENEKSVVVEINDRGPFTRNKIIDLSKKAAEKIDMITAGAANIKMEIIGYQEINLESVVKYYKNILRIKQNNNK